MLRLLESGDGIGEMIGRPRTLRWTRGTGFLEDPGDKAAGRSDERDATRDPEVLSFSFLLRLRRMGNISSICSRNVHS